MSKLVKRRIKENRIKPAHWMKVSETIRRVLVTFSKSNGKDSVIPSESQTINIIISFEWMHMKVVVLNSIRLILFKIVDNDLRRDEVGKISK
ncbi:CLUMA_CG014747, isoform A [Clunio marinus]|uniref:CLUMA_CG014747, isoform A n=1 Tax=Clunio marinus TaxID=568069 RepID=A0A1J1IP39_9DIPT|nr:CLUMA_CG014747, isoform A [Clunio marinus]